MSKQTKLLALVMSTVMILTALSGCSTPDTGWMVQLGEEKLSSGSYNMLMLYNIIGTQGGMESFDQEKAITAAKTGAENMLALHNKFTAMGLTLDPDELAAAEARAASDYSQLTDMMVANGILEEDILAIYKNSLIDEAVFEATYGPGGEKEVPREELLDGFATAYTRSQYLLFIKIDNMGTPLPEDEMAKVRTQANDFFARAQVEGQSFAALVRELDDLNGITEEYEDYQYDVIIPKNGTSFPEVYETAVVEAEEGTIQMVEDDQYIFILYKMPVREVRDELLAQYLYVFKYDAFAAEISDWIAEQEFIYNEEALAVHTPENLKISDDEIAEALGKGGSGEGESSSSAAG